MHTFSGDFLLLTLTALVTVGLDLSIKKLWRKRKQHGRKSS